MAAVAAAVGRRFFDCPGQERLLLAVSLFVVASWQWQGLVVTLGLVLLTWLSIRGAQRLHQPARSRVVMLASALLIAALVLSKQHGWLDGLVPSAWPSAAAPVIGISYTVFRLVGALLDAVNLRIPVALSRLTLLAVFFPTFSAGPIATVLSFQRLDRESAADDLREGLRRVFGGLCRKLLLADVLGNLIDAWLADVAALTPEQCAVLPYLLGLRLYWDFSGYSAIAIGLARIGGFRVPENFDRPFLSADLVEFWQRWHVTLSEWIRTRVFVKLVRRQVSVQGAALASMVLCGLWHGLGLHYLAWGLWHAAGVVASYAVRQRAEPGPAGRAARVAATLMWVSVGWLFFFFSAGQAFSLLGRAPQVMTSPVALLLFATGAAVTWLACAAETRIAAVLGATHPVARGFIYALLTWGLILRSDVGQQFVYFQF